MHTDTPDNPWASKIDSEEKLSAVLNKVGYPDTPNQVIRRPSIVIDSGLPWWIMREQCREAAGYYPAPSSVLVSLRGMGYCGQYFPHISPSDPSMIAYTPDQQAGMADKQVKTTMGRFLRKFLILYTDTHIAQLEATHRAETDTSFEVARTIDEIEHVFTHTVGASSCMSYVKGDSHFSHRKYHPSAVYSGPGLGVAYFRNGAGEIAARAVVYENPDDPTDKRYVRIYGDSVLRRKLEANGYRAAGLAGAKLPMLYDRESWKTDHGSNARIVVMPYLDPPGGRNSGLDDKTGTYVAWHKGEDFLRVLSNDQASRYHGAGLNCSSAQSTNGHITVHEIDISKAVFTCGLSGKAVNKLENKVVTCKVVLESGEFVEALTSARDEMGYGETSIRRILDGTITTGYTSRAIYEKFANKVVSGVFDDDATLAYYGWYRLSAEVYPDVENRLISEFDSVELPDGSRVRKSDVVRIRENGNWEFKLTMGDEAVKALRKQGYVVVAKGDANTIARYIHKSDPDVVRTVSGRRAVIGFSRIAKRIDGQWDFTRNMNSFSVADCDVWIPGSGVGGVAFDLDVMFENEVHNKRLFLERWNDDQLAGYFAGGCSSYGNGGGYAVVNDSGEPSYVTNRRNVTLPQLVKAAEWIIANFSDKAALRPVIGHSDDWPWIWSNTLVEIVKRREAAKRAEFDQRIAEAEANAVDYTDDSTPGSVSVIKDRAAKLVAELDELMGPHVKPSAAKVRMDVLYRAPVAISSHPVVMVSAA